jgi:hypothetical protein
MGKAELVSEEEYHLALGRAVSMWSAVEVSLGELMFAAIKPPTKTTLLRAYYSVQNFRDRLNMINAALAWGLLNDAASTEAWTNLYERIKGASTSRNRNVHAMTWITDDVGFHGRRHLVFDEETRMSPWKLRDTSITPNRLQEDMARFQMLAAEIRDFTKKLPALVP